MSRYIEFLAASDIPEGPPAQRKRTPAEALEEAARRLGNRSRLAEALGARKQAAYEWRQAPYKRVLDIERLTGVSRHELRPDIYPEE